MSKHWQFPGSYGLHFVLIKCQISSSEHLFLHMADNAVNQVQLKANCAGEAHLMFKTKLTVLLDSSPSTWVRIMLYDIFLISNKMRAN